MSLLLFCFTILKISVVAKPHQKQLSDIKHSANLNVVVKFSTLNCFEMDVAS